jgi:hypothetical protein
MGKRRTVRQSLGHKTGTKRSDRHWTDPEGNIWDSRYEYTVYAAYKAAGYAVRRTSKIDTMAFILPIRGGKCGACGATEVGQQRTYTPDLHVAADHKEYPAITYYIEAKGYLRAKERSLLRNFYKAHPDASVRYLLQRSYPAGKLSKITGKRSSIIDWFHKFLPKALICIWSGNVPKESDWRQAAPAAAKLPSTRTKKVRLETSGRVSRANVKRRITDHPTADSGAASAAIPSTNGKSAKRKRKAKVGNS